MPMYKVILEAVIDGSAAGSTCDLIEAADADAAEAHAIAAWKRVEPRFTFRPLVTLEQT